VTLYLVGGHVLESDVTLPELSVCGKGTASITFELLPAGRSWPARWRTDDGAAPGAPSEGRRPDGFVLRFPGVAAFRVAPDGRRVECRPRPGASPAAVRHRLLDQVLPQTLALRGRTVLHASAVGLAGLAGLAVGFLGPSGAGKSTLAATLALAGHDLLADDWLLVEWRVGAPCVVPSYGGVRVAPHGATAHRGHDRAPPDDTGKVRLDLRDRAGTSPASLRALYMLAPFGPAVAPIVERLSRREAVTTLLEHTYHLGLDEPVRMAEQFDGLTRLAGTVPVHRLVVPDGLPLATDAVVGALTTVTGRQPA